MQIQADLLLSVVLLFTIFSNCCKYKIINNNNNNNNNETDYSCKQLLKDSYLTFNDLEGQHTLISLWFQRQVAENRKGNHLLDTMICFGDNEESLKIRIWL